MSAVAEAASIRREQPLRLPAEMPPRQDTYVAVAIRNLQAAGQSKPAALLGAARACGVIWKFAVARQKLGHWPTQEQYAEYWNDSLRTTQRDWARVKQAFPTETDPQRLAKHLLGETAGQLEDSSAGLVTPFPRDLIAA